MHIGDDLSRRAVVVVLLVALQAGLLLDYGAYEDRQPTAEDYATDYETYVGQTVTFDATVVSTDPTVVVLDGTDERLELTLRNFDRDVQRGTAVDITGTLQANHSVSVQGSVLSPSTNRTYMYGISFAALLFVVALCLRDWRLDTDRLVFRKRGED
ncbi:hypothetical protein [Halorientalis salina]|uniref:hypothetical protein n=1 Tax=Halorientalis salina TaxID=2932266 RepID=UPI0010AC80F3|nr:hypothetical protein [Halorientalis salina]